jgi:hypothetical protein
MAEYTLAQIRQGTGFDPDVRFQTVERHNGWANYPTWAVNLWLSNDEPLYRQTLEAAEAIKQTAKFDENTKSGIWTEDETAKYRLADHLKSWVSDELAPDLGASFAADLLGYALGEVDWTEIAESWLERD